MNRHIQPSKQLVEMKLNAILKASHDGLWVIDKDGIVLHANEAAHKINNLDGIEVIGKNIRELHRNGVFGNQKLASLEVLEKRKPCTIIQDLPNGEKTLVTGTPFFDQRGELTLVVVNDRDISHLNRLAAELERNRTLIENLASHKMHVNQIDFSDVIARSASMRMAVDKAVRVSKVDSTVLIQGETGVGKNIVARLIHDCSDRRERPFISINCSAVPEPLIESEFFGYEYGAFTGSRREGKKGLVEMADGGNLFLDEIGDLSLSAQAKLLKFLENKEIFRLGSSRPKRLDIRLIAATNKSLKEMVSKGIFRQDLFFRLSVISIFVPPLRERREDIRHLVDLFLKRTNKKYQLDKEVSQEALEFLTCLPYPGNVRELENLIEHLAVTTEDKVINVSDFPLSFTESSDVLRGETLKDSVLRFEMKLITSAIRRYGSQKKAGAVLGVDQSTIARKMEKFRETLSSIVHEGKHVRTPSLED